MNFEKNKNGTYTIYSPKDLTLGSGEVAWIDLGFRIEIPPNKMCLLIGRSGMHGKWVDPVEFFNGEMEPLGMLIGSIKGNWGVVVKNFTSRIVCIKEGDKLCGFVVIPIVSLE